MKIDTLRFQNSHWDRVENFFHDPSLERFGKSERYFREIIAAVISKKFEPLDAHLITQMTDVGSHNTIAGAVYFCPTIR
ncbi:MAG TPA: hypothetical protein VK469_19230 [Candidatus Kapabacteria bacterium]|nr:hypothetical protein [Candidatus Kapabacteria bacterium]